MRGGGQKDVIEIQRKVQMGKDAYNAPLFVWKLFADPFVEWSAKRGKEQFDPGTQQRYSEEVYQFRTRYEEVLGIDASMRVVFDGQYYDIKSLLPAKTDIIIECTLQDGSIGGEALMGFLAELPGESLAGAPIVPFVISAKGGSSPYVFSAASGLPVGLIVDADSGEVSGTPSAPGTATVTLRVTDAEGVVDDLPPVVMTIA